MTFFKASLPWNNKIVGFAIRIHTFDKKLFQILEKHNVLSSKEVQFSRLRYAFHCKFHSEFNHAA